MKPRMQKEGYSKCVHLRSRDSQKIGEKVRTY